MNMYTCLFKKVTVHNSAKIKKLSCNRVNQCIGIGGSEGFVKVVKIDLVNNKPDSTGKVNPLTFTQNLVHHRKKILNLVWNDTYEKITTSDEDGIIVVWKFENNQWSVEMVNNREISYVTDIKWSKQGIYLCFVYDDGHAIVGTVEGARCWGNDIKEKIYKLEWSPDASVILFAPINYNVIVFHSSGYQIGEISISNELKNIKLAAMSWWNNLNSDGMNSTDLKHLCFAFTNGWIYLYDDHQDTNPLSLKSDYTEIINAEWSPQGDILAVGGTYQDNYDTKYSVNFYDRNLKLVKILKV